MQDMGHQLTSLAESPLGGGRDNKGCCGIQGDHLQVRTLNVAGHGEGEGAGVDGCLG